MQIDNFGIRLTKLRQQKNVSARDMSLTLGQNPGYINSIESGKSLPSMKQFFYICEFLDITPSQFFDVGIECPKEYDSLLSYAKKMTPNQLENITAIMKDIIDK